MAAQSANNTSGERSATDYDRARFGQQREVWGSENTHSMTQANMNSTYVQRLRAGHDWVGVDKESIVHENEGMSSRVTLTHWKDHRIEFDAQRAKTLSSEAHTLSQQWEEEKKNVHVIEKDKGKVYDLLCTEKYDNSDLQSECIRLEECIQKEKTKTKSTANQTKKIMKLVEEEKEVTLRTKQRANYLEKERIQRLKERATLKCCGTCCTSCCWVKNSCTAFWQFTFPVVIGMTLPCRCSRVWWCCAPEICCEKQKIITTLDPATSFRNWSKTLTRIKREEMDSMLHDMV